MKRVALLTSLLIASTALGGCDTIGNVFSSSKESPLRVQNVGPSIKDVLKPLPKNLVGDEDNKLYGFDELRPPRGEDDLL